MVGDRDANKTKGVENRPKVINRTIARQIWDRRNHRSNKSTPKSVSYRLAMILISIPCLCCSPIAKTCVRKPRLKQATTVSAAPEHFIKVVHFQYLLDSGQQSAFY
jgi:hypothetical protein